MNYMKETIPQKIDASFEYRVTLRQQFYNLSENKILQNMSMIILFSLLMTPDRNIALELSQNLKMKFT